MITSQDEISWFAAASDEEPGTEDISTQGDRKWFSCRTNLQEMFVCFRIHSGESDCSICMAPSPGEVRVLELWVAASFSPVPLSEAFNPSC